MQEDVTDEAKIGLGIVSFLVAVLFGLASQSFIVGVVAAVIYPVTAWASVKVMKRVWRIALFKDDDFPLSVATFWPITLPLLLIYSFFGTIINRLFPSKK
jgi:hypothetical protein